MSGSNRGSGGPPARGGSGGSSGGGQRSGGQGGAPRGGPGGQRSGPGGGGQRSGPGGGGQRSGPGSGGPSRGGAPNRPSTPNRGPSRGGPNRGGPNRGGPNRGAPNRAREAEDAALERVALAAGVLATKPAQKRVITEVEVGDFITVRDLAGLMERSPIDLIKVLMQYGIMAPITHSIDHDTAVILGEELNVAVKWPDTGEAHGDEEEGEDGAAAPTTKPTLVKEVLGAESEQNLVERAPVVAILGHVDHGKTTLLDRIRHTDVASGEAGGITQRTGAYQVTVNGRKITFLDTPGHEAFTAMRARGAKVTDIVVLVVAADDGVMPQTREAISHAKAAGVHIIVALNKVDKPNANPDRVKTELAEQGLQPEEYGGETIVVPVSALKNQGIDDLLDNILVVAELENYRANPKGRLIGTVIESALDKFRGVTTTLLVQNGTLRPGSTIVVGNTWGKVKAMFDHEGKALKSAGPSTPVVILGLQESPNAGDVFEGVASDREAKQIVDERRQAEAARAGETAQGRPRMSLEEIFARFEGGEAKSLNLIVRADLQGTLEPVLKSLQDLANEEIGVDVLQAAVGNISESDVMLAEASDAVIIGFSVGVDKAAAMRAEQSGVEIRHYNVIYKMIEDVQDALTGMLEPVYDERTTGHASVLQLFKLRRGTIAGCSVSDGIIKRGAAVRVLRDGQPVMANNRVETLRRFTEDVQEVRTGFECGILLQDHSDDLLVGDIIEAFEKVRVR